MAYDGKVVAFTDEEHRMAAKFDKVIESLSDGVDLSDMKVLLDGASLLKYLAADGYPAIAVKRLLTLALMIERDNDYLGKFHLN